MEIKLIDPRSLVENPDRARRTKSSPQSDALLLATIRAVGIVHGAGGVIAIRIHRTFSADSTLRFSILERPAQGSVRVFNREGDGAELVYLAAHRADAEEWLSRHGYPNAVLDEVSADEAAADTVEGTVV